ncbi:MAG: aldehyde dehydrogenase, partial [Crocinitomicaceae bacterium]
MHLFMTSQVKVIGVNGFGRIGRYFTRLSLQQASLDVAVVNDLAPIETLAHLFKYDSVHGGLKVDFKREGNALVFENGKKIVFTQEKNPANIPWSEYGVNYVLESTGLFLTRETAQAHLGGTVQKVILSAPANDDTKTIVLGVNDSLIEATDIILSNASCTTNSAAPLVQVLLEMAEIESAYITTIHSYTT